MSLFDLSRIPVMRWTGVLCRECGERKPRWTVEDGWCDRCRGLEPEPIVVPPVEIEPAEWRIEGSTWPGMRRLHEQVFTFTEAVAVARRFGGRVRPFFGALIDALAFANAATSGPCLSAV